MTVFVGRGITAKLISVLQGAGLTVGDGVAPEGMTKGCVVYPLAGGIADGPIDDPHADAELTYQVTSVGMSRQQVEWVADTVRTVVLTADLSVPGRKVTFVWMDMAGGAMRDDDVQPALFTWPERFRLGTVPG